MALTLGLSACDNFPDLHPTVPDFQLREARVYEVVDKENLVIRFKKTIPLEKVNGYYCFSQPEMVALKVWIVENKHKCER